jgi:hypothetical protein
MKNYRQTLKASLLKQVICMASVDKKKLNLNRRNLLSQKRKRINLKKMKVLNKVKKMKMIRRIKNRRRIRRRMKKRRKMKKMNMNLKKTTVLNLSHVLSLWKYQSCLSLFLSRLILWNYLAPTLSIRTKSPSRTD